ALGGLKSLLDKEKGKTDAHTLNTENPHSVTKVQVGLSNVDNTSDASKPISTAQAAAIDERIPKTDISQVLGTTATKIPSEKAVTDAMASAGYGDMLKAVYDTTNNGVVDDAAKLGNQPPAYYAKKSEVDVAQGAANAAQRTADAAVCASATPRGYGSNNANDIRDGWTVCNSGLSDGMRGWAYVLQTSFIATGESGKAQIAISYAYEPATVAMRFYGGGKWLAWQEAMPKSGGNFSGMIKAPQVEANALSVGNNNISTNRIGFPASGGSQVGSDAYGCAGSFSTNGFYVKGLDNTWKPVYASTFSQQSSIAEKSNIKIFKGGLEILIRTNVYWYERLGGVAQIGLVIEDKTTPNEVKTQNAQGLVSIDLYSFISLVSQAVKELKAEKDTEIAELKAANTAILKRLEILEGKVK
ncbi:MAG: hypothetical protein RSD64_03965, partial [Christensenellaceae bacterium]